MRDTSLSSEYRPRRKRLFEYFERRLETGSQLKFRHLWSPISFLGKSAS
jgi:hypothetical protein